MTLLPERTCRKVARFSKPQRGQANGKAILSVFNKLLSPYAGFPAFPIPHTLYSYPMYFPVASTILDLVGVRCGILG